MSNATDEDASRPALKLVKSAAKNVALNMIPGYPIVGAIRSFHEATRPGATVIADLTQRLPQRHAKRPARSWNQALAARPDDALPLQQIERSNICSKQIFMTFFFLAFGSLAGNTIAGHILGVINSALLMLLCLLQVFMYELRLRQMETGPVSPDAPLMSPGELIRQRGFLRHLFNPRIGWK
jgi:hypothetical protein